MSSRQRLMAGLPLLPLATLFAINFFDQFDTAAFSVLTPEIKRAFHLSTGGIAAIGAVNFLLTSCFVLVIGYWADRGERKRLVVISGVVAAVSSFLTGAAVGVVLLVTLRLINGVGRLVNDPVHTSMLTDYYPVDRRGEAFSVHRSADPLGQIAGPVLAGGVAALFSWRWAFFALSIPALFAALYARRLVEPVKGATDDHVAANETADEPPMPFGRAWRVLSNVRTLRRVWLASLFAGAGLGPLIPIFSLYWEKEYDVGSFGRGFITAGGAACGLIGLLTSGAAINRLLARSPERVQLLAGAVLTLNAALLLVVAWSPNIAFALVAYLLISTGFGVFVPSSIGVASVVIPARARSQGFAYGPLFLALGAILSAPLGGIADTHGYRWTLFAFAPVVLTGGLVYASAARFVRGDNRRALQALDAEVALRAQRLAAGRRSLVLARNIDVSYDLVPVLHQVEVDIHEGEILALLGTNGAGKSTLLRTIAGLVHPDDGVVFYDGRDITFYEPEETAAAGIVLSPGGQAMFPDLTVRESLLAACWPLRRDPDAVRQRVAEVVELFPRLQERLDQKAGTMSGGEQQMLALAQALMSRPRLLMIDELTLGLAPKIVEELLASVKAIHATGVTIVLVEQSINIALTVADRAYFMERGRIMFEGPTEELMARDDLVRAVFLKPEVVG